MYFQHDALYVAFTHIVISSKMGTQVGEMTTTTTTNNTYSSIQEVFPSEVYAGNVETSSGQWTTTGTTVAVVLGHTGSSSINKTGTQDVHISVEGNEQIIVGAGTFPSALKLLVTITTYENGTSTPYDYTAWYAEGVGLVKMTSANMNRDLVSYHVNPVESSSEIQIPGNLGSFTSLQDAFDAASVVSCK